MTDKNRALAIKAFDTDSFDSEFSAIYPFKHALLGTSNGRDRVKAQVRSLFRLSEVFDADDVKRQVAAIKKRLGNGSVEQTKFNELGTRIDAVETALSTTVIKKLSAKVSAAGPDNFVNTFRDLEEEDEVAAYIRGYKSSTFKAHFHYLFDGEELDRVSATGPSEDRNEARRQIREFAGLSSGTVRHDYFRTVLQEFDETLTRVPSENIEAEYQPVRAALAEDITKIGVVVSKERLETLFGGEKINDVHTDYANFGEQLRGLKENEVKGYIQAFQPASFTVHFRYITKNNPERYLATNKDDMQNQLKNFLGMEGTIDNDDIQTFVDLAKRTLAKHSAFDAAKARELAQLLDQVPRVLSDRFLSQLYT